MVSYPMMLVTGGALCRIDHLLPMAEALEGAISVMIDLKAGL